MSKEFVAHFAYIWGTKCKSSYSGKQRLLLAVYEDCGGICHICSEKVYHPVHELFEITDLNAPTLDHIIPKSICKTSPRHNMALAHRICNSVRGVREVTEKTKLEILNDIEKILNRRQESHKKSYRVEQVLLRKTTKLILSKSL